MKKLVLTIAVVLLGFTVNAQYPYKHIKTYQDTTEYSNIYLGIDVEVNPQNEVYDEIYLVSHYKNKKYHIFQTALIIPLNHVDSFNLFIKQSVLKYGVWDSISRANNLPPMNKQMLTFPIKVHGKGYDHGGFYNHYVEVSANFISWENGGSTCQIFAKMSDTHGVRNGGWALYAVQTVEDGSRHKITQANYEQFISEFNKQNLENSINTLNQVNDLLK